MPHPDVFLGHSFLLKQCVDGLLARDAPSWLGLEIWKKFNVRCAWESIFVSVEKSFVTQVFTLYIYIKYALKTRRTFFEHFSGTHTFQTVPKHVWMRNWQLVVVTDQL